MSKTLVEGTSYPVGGGDKLEVDGANLSLKNGGETLSEVNLSSIQYGTPSWFVIGDNDGVLSFSNANTFSQMLAKAFGGTWECANPQGVSHTEEVYQGTNGMSSCPGAASVGGGSSSVYLYTYLFYRTA